MITLKVAMKNMNSRDYSGFSDILKIKVALIEEDTLHSGSLTDTNL